LAAAVSLQAGRQTEGWMDGWMDGGMEGRKRFRAGEREREKETLLGVDSLSGQLLDKLCSLSAPNLLLFFPLSPQLKVSE